MKVLDRYFGGVVFGGCLVVTLVLGTIFGFVETLAQLESVGEGRYRVVDALFYVLLVLPDRFMEIVPLIALLGSMIALGGMASANELVAMRATGVSIRQIATSVAKVAVGMMFAVALLQWYAVPPLEQRAQALRAGALANNLVASTEQGFWSRHRGEFINVRSVLMGAVPADIDIYRFARDGELLSYTHASWADVRDQASWVLGEVTYKFPQGDGLQTRRLDTLTWRSFLTAEQLGLLVLPPDSLAPVDLLHYVRDLHDRGQDPGPLEFLLWRRLLMPLAVAAMVMLALPFSLLQMRRTAMSYRIVIGGAIGIAFHFANQIVGHLGSLAGLSPAMTSVFPILLLLGATYWSLNRVG